MDSDDDSDDDDDEDDAPPTVPARIMQAKRRLAHRLGARANSDRDWEGTLWGATTGDGGGYA